MDQVITVNGGCNANSTGTGPNDNVSEYSELLPDMSSVAPDLPLDE
jgi:hypothetical protein